MKINIVTASKEYLRLVEQLKLTLAEAKKRLIIPYDLNSILAKLPKPYVISSSELFRNAIKIYQEIFSYYQAPSSENLYFTTSDKELNKANQLVYDILKPIIDTKPKQKLEKEDLNISDLNILDCYYFALSDLAIVVGSIGKIEYRRIDSEQRAKEVIISLLRRLESVKNCLDLLTETEISKNIQAPEETGWWFPDGNAILIAKDTDEAEKTWLKMQGEHATISIKPEGFKSNYDAFISHATEDKDDLVRPLAEDLIKSGLSIWYDELELKIGDSLRRSIDRGLANSRFGIVVLSEAFFNKNWPQYELDGLVTKEMEGHKIILPIWHKLTKDQVITYSPSLADKIALSTSIYSIKELSVKLANVIKKN